MAVTEHTRHQLYERLREVLGEEEAATLMELVPPVGWADVATKRDLDHLEHKLDARFEAIDARFESIDARFESIDARFDGVDTRIGAMATKEDLWSAFSTLQRDLRIQLYWQVGFVLSVLAAVLAVTRL